MLFYSEQVFEHIKAMIEKLDLSVDNVVKEVIASDYYTLLGYVSGYKAFVIQYKALVGSVTPVDVAFINLLDSLIAYLSRGGFDFDQWAECLEYIYYDCRDECLNFQRSLIDMSVDVLKK